MTKYSVPHTAVTIRISKRKLPNGDNMYMYFVSNDKHCGTWTQGKGWEFPITAEIPNKWGSGKTTDSVGYCRTETETVKVRDKDVPLSDFDPIEENTQ